MQKAAAVWVRGLPGFNNPKASWTEQWPVRILDSHGVHVLGPAAVALSFSCEVRVAKPGLRCLAVVHVKGLWTGSMISHHVPADPVLSSSDCAQFLPSRT